MKKQLLSVFFLFFSFLSIVHATERDSIFQKNFVTPPVNDECSGAIIIPVNPTLEVVTSVPGTTVDATINSGLSPNPCVGNQYQKDIWFNFTATAKRHVVNFDSISLQFGQVYFSVYSGACSNLQITHCGVANDPSMSVIGNLTIGVSYKIRVVVQNNLPATFNIALTTPAAVPNDNCNAAIVIPVNPNMESINSISGDIQGASPSTAPDGCFGDSDKDDMWYRFVATSKQHIIKLDTEDGNYFNIDIFSGTACGSSILLSCWSSSNYLIQDLTIGATYRIKVSNSEWADIVPVLFTLSIMTPPTLVNDGCSTSISIPVNPSSEGELFVQGNSFGANTSGLQDSCYGDHNDVWFDFTALSTSQVITFFDLDESVTGIRYVVYSGGCNELLSIGCGNSTVGLFNNFVAGNNYKVRVQNYLNNSFLPGTFKIAITTPVVPVNDNCENAIAVPVNAGTSSDQIVLGSTYAASPSMQSTACAGNEDDDIWYSFVATSNIHLIKIDNVEGNTATINHSVFSGNDCETMTQLYCSTKNSLAKNLVIGNTYKIRIYSNLFGTNHHIAFQMSITTPQVIFNDECSVAIPVEVSESVTNPSFVAGALTGATASPQTTACIGTEDDDVWYKFVATSPKHIIMIDNVQGSSTDLVHSLFSGGNCDNIVQLYCSDSDISTAENLIVGNEYKIRVWSKTNGVQTLTYDITFDLAVLNINPPLIANTTQFTNEQLVTNILVNNPCVNISNITSSTGSDFGDVNGIGYFTNTNPWFSINSGIVLSTGNAALVGGPNSSTLGQSPSSWNLPDSDLEALFLESYGQVLNSKNVTKLEFDFTSQNEFMSFNFLFASEEYGGFQCQYADAFAFLLTDLITGVTTNLAVVPGTSDPVSVISIRNNMHNPSCTSVNEGFFDTYFDGILALAAPTNFNGQTALMSASSQIIANNPYHIKLVIADREDAMYDSAVFIQAGSFSSGPPQCTDKVQLVTFIDENNNGTKEDTESSFTYGSFVYQVNNTGDINNISSPIGNYAIYDSNPLNSYDFSYEVHPEYANYFSSGTIIHNDISIAVGSGTQTLYFPITQIQGYNDVTVSIVPVGQPTAGFSYTNKIVYTNLGTSATSGTINYTKDPLVAVASAQAGVVNSSDGFTYNFVNLAPFETRSFNFTINVPSIPIVNIDDILESSVAISAPSDDINSSNNTFTNSQIVVASYDPNDKMEAHGGKLDFNNFSQDDYLFYTIRFQNTGTANAINIRVEDVLDAQLDEESIRMVSASHNYVMERVGNKLVWKFDYIYLPSMLANEELSNGYLTFKIKVKPGFEVGDIIPNFAEIYFDTNPAIITNIFNSTFEVQLSTPEFSPGNLLIYPNPSNGLVYINTQNTTENLQAIQLYDVLGKTILSSENLSAKQSTIDVSALSKGVYMIEITTENNFKQTKRLVVN